jgi:hypothetical protein
LKISRAWKRQKLFKSTQFYIFAAIIISWQIYIVGRRLPAHEKQMIGRLSERKCP